MKTSTSTPQKAVVIGGGFSGLAAAALLAKDGWNVLLLEKNTELGGRARVLNKKGYRFDMGPSWYLMPEVFETFFSHFGKKSSDYYSLKRLNPRFTVFFGQEKKVTLTDDLEENAAWFESIEAGAGEQLKLFLHKMEKIYNAASQLLYDDMWSPQTWMKRKNIQAAVTMFRNINLLESWDTEVSKHFKNEKLQKVLEFSAVFLGTSPYKTPSFYSILSWADFGNGVWYPEGGMGKVVEALERLCAEYGVEVLKGIEATSIEVSDGKVSAVIAGRNRFEADVVIGAADMPTIETKLLAEQYQSWDATYWEKKKLGITALLLYLGVDKKLPQVTHHNLYFSENWKKNFDQVFEEKVLPDDPSLYISVRSVTDRSIVPEGQEEIFVLVPLGAGGKYDKKSLNTFTEKIIDKVENVLGTKIRSHLVVKKVYTPSQFGADYNAYKDTALGLAHTLDQSLWFRPRNKSFKVKGLYYTGQYTNPGVGVPMALISAEIVAKLIGCSSEKNDDIFKKGSVTYYYSSFFFQGQVKRDVATLYAYVRTADDFVDAAIPQPLLLKKHWDDTLIEWNGGRSNNTLVKNFVSLAKRKHFALEWVAAFCDAMRSDLTKKKYSSYRELEEYMYGSAEVIGLMMARILGLPAEAEPAAAKQGKAMQFVNFIRDVAEDESLGRNYLGYTKKQKNDPVLWKEFIEKSVRTYLQLQKDAELGYQHLPKKYLIPIKTASDMYNWTAEMILKDPSVVWKKKMKPNKLRVLSKGILNIFATYED